MGDEVSEQLQPDAGRRDAYPTTTSAVLRSGEVAAVSAKFAEGHARIREVIDLDGACPAWAKAMYVAGAAAGRGHHELVGREMARARELGLSARDARGSALVILISRGEASYGLYAAAVDAEFGPFAAAPTGEPPRFVTDRESAIEHFRGYFGHVPAYVELMADEAPRALEGYVLMREWSLGENVLDPKQVELLLCAVNAADFSSRFVAVHAAAARRAGASEAEIVEAALCAIPVVGLASWLTAADGILET